MGPPDAPTVELHWHASTLDAQTLQWVCMTCGHRDNAEQMPR